MEIDVETAGEGLGIRYSRPTFESEGRRLPPSAERTLEQAASLVPDFRVSRDGSFAGLRDIAQFRADVLEYMERSVSQDLPPEAQARIREGLSSELTIRDKTRSRWDAIVGSWSGAQVKLGVPLVTLAPQSIPLFPGRSILMRLVRTARRLVPCARGGQARTCIELEVLAASDPADAARLIEAIRKDFSAKEQREDAMFESIEMYSALRVTTEPDGLYPHKVWSRRVTRARFSRQGHEWHADQTTELRESYAYR